jgi:hypothetical protein
MKKIFTTILIVLFGVTTLKSQDLNTPLDFINKYRTNYGLNPITYSKEINSKVVSHTSELVSFNKNKEVTTIYHSKNHTKENVVHFSTNSKNVTGWSDHEFYDFIKKEFNLTKEDITNDNYPILLTIYAWDGSPKHKAGMLDESGEKGSVSLQSYTTKVYVGSTEFTFLKWFGTFSWE